MNELPPEFIDAMDPVDARATVIHGRRGYTVRFDRPVAQWLAGSGRQPQTLALELLIPQTARPRLPAGTAFHLAVGTTAVARGRVVALL